MLIFFTNKHAHVGPLHFLVNRNPLNSIIHALILMSLYREESQRGECVFNFVN